MKIHVLKRRVAFVCFVIVAALLMLGQSFPTASAKPVEPQGTVGVTQQPPPTTEVPTTPVPPSVIPTTPVPATEIPTGEPVATDVPTRAPEDRTGNVAVVKRADLAEARIGDTVAFSIQVTNPSRYDTPGVVLTDELPGYFEVLSASATRGAPVVSGNTLTVDLDTVVSGEEILITVQVRVLEGAPEVMVNIARLTSPNSSDSAEDNISRATVRLIDDMASAPRPDVTGTATALPGAGGTPTVTPVGGGTGAPPTATPRPPRRLPVTGEDGGPTSLVLMLIGAGLAVTAGSLLLRRRA